ncbi:MAG: hypothetical protein JOZ17_19105 [Acetobacteraceae bacterium]|nr:hypothetical protein [Acetobacteraceae bacterium]
MTHHLLIATPTAGGVVKALYASTVVQTVKAIMHAGWSVDLVTLDSSYVTKARNLFANMVLRERHFSHLVMIDSDMSFAEHVICRMIQFDKPVVAAAYSQRRMDMGAFLEAARKSDLTLDGVTALTLDYNIKPRLEPGSRRVKIVDGRCCVSHVALGCAVIRRDALEWLADAGIVRLGADEFLEKSGLKGPFYNFFGEIALENGDTLSEDYSFCKRWLSVPENEIWVFIDEPIGHVGDMVYGAPYMDRLLQGKA